MSLIKVNNLSFEYSKEDKALKNINLKIEKGDFICIIGENGSRKKYTCKMYCRIKQNTKKFYREEYKNRVFTSKNRNTKKFSSIY